MTRGWPAAIIGLFVLILLGMPSTVFAQTSCSIRGNPNFAFGEVSVIRNQAYGGPQELLINCARPGPVDQPTMFCFRAVSSSEGTGSDQRSFFLTTRTQPNPLQIAGFADPALSRPMTQGVWEQVLLAGSGDLVVPLYPRVLGPQPSVTPGAYRGTIRYESKFGGRAEMGGSCESTNTYAVRNYPVDYTATVIGECVLFGATLNFGSATRLASAIDAQTSIPVTCTSTLAYTLGLNGGSNGGTTAVNRRMRRNGGSTSEYITYGLYTDPNRGTGWFGNGERRAGTGLSQPMAVYGRVPAQSPTPLPGIYEDQVVITVTY